MGAGRLSVKKTGQFKDEVYRQMLRLEAGHTAALPLAVALLHAWTVCDQQPATCEFRQWLRRVSPICLQMIADSNKAMPHAG
jgi:hypothetical protein